MKTLLIFPPYLRNNWIHLAVPLLNGQLEAAGFLSRGLDLNCDFFNYILSEHFMLNSLKKMEKIYDEIKLRVKEEEGDKFQRTHLIMKKNFLEMVLYSQRNNVLDFISNISKLKKHIFSNSKLEDKHYKSIELAIAISMFPYQDNNCLSYKDLKEQSLNLKNNIYYSFFKKYINEIANSEYEFIGITISFFSQLLPSFTLASILKKNTNSKILFGGVFLSSIIEKILVYGDLFDTFCDYILIGEGEESIVDFSKCIKNGKALDNVNGLIYKNQKGEIIKNKPNIIKDINKVKDISLNGYDLNKYVRKNLPVEFSKGCYWGKCVFCYSSNSHHYYQYSPVEAVNKIERLSKKYNIKSFDIIDDALSPSFIKGFAKEILSRNLDINYGVFLRFEKAYDYDFFKLLKKSGLRTIFWGYETASWRLLRLMNKTRKFVNREKIIDSAIATGISNKIGFILGFPSETKEEMEQTLKVINKYKEKCGLSINIFTLYDYSDIMKDEKKYGIINTIPLGELSGIIDFSSNGIDNNKLIELLEKYNINCPEKSLLGNLF